jgi:GNAT superfamily N-acetyltransferase
VSRRVRALDGQQVELLPERCRACLFWELGWPRPDPRGHDPADDLAGDPVAAKQAWCTNQVLAGRPPGRVVIVDEELAGYALFAPAAEFAPRRMVVPPTSRDALLLATLWVSPFHREHGIGRLLVQAAIKEALRLDLRAVEAYGDRRWRETDCVMPCTWLLHEGFEVAVEHPRYPLLRLETRRSVLDALEHAVEEVLERIPRRIIEAPVPVREARTQASMTDR